MNVYNERTVAFLARGGARNFCLPVEMPARSAKAAERRSISNLIETAALRHLQESSFADDAEMAEILSRPELIKRLKAGSRDAHRRQGRFVPAV